MVNKAQMRCEIVGESVKLFAKAVHCLAKIGDDIYVEPLKKGLSLRTVSSSRSAYACFVFMISFFQSYDDGSSSDQDNSSPEEGLKCKLSVKSCLSVFKSLSTIERNVERCSIKMNDREDQLTFLLFCRHGVTKTYNLSYQDCESLQAIFTKDLCPNLIIIQPSMLSEVVTNFHNSQEEITLTVCPQNMVVTNYIDEDQDHERVINTKMVLIAEEFEKFKIGVDAEVTFCLKELKGILTFAESSGQNIDIHFESGGKPIVFSVVSDLTFEATFVLATLMDQPGTQISQQKKPEKSQKPSKSKDTQRPQTVVLDDDEFGLNEEDEGDWANDVIAVEEKLAQETLRGNHVDENNASVLSKKASNVQSSKAQSSKNNQSSPVEYIQSPSSCIPSDLVQKCTEMPAFGDSLSADSENSPGIAVRSGKDKTARLERHEGDRNVLDDEEQTQDSVPGTPPSKKFKSMLFSSGLSESQRVRNKRTVKQSASSVLVEGSDEEDD